MEIKSILLKIFYALGFLSRPRQAFSQPSSREASRLILLGAMPILDCENTRPYVVFTVDAISQTIDLEVGFHSTLRSALIHCSNIN